MQTKKQSIIESITNTAVGYFISLLSLFVIFPPLGISSSPGKNITISLYFTAISIARGYVLRRFFNNKHNKTMNINQTNKNEHERLKYLIENEQDEFSKKCLQDDLNELEANPKKYWMRFKLDAFQPGDIIETQRVNTIAVIQKFYSNN
ncbi:hypothetical protein [Draconibacterium sp.]|uniref:DUF7220 family protein n=1 Tax=Draconibacterium sp. TaxID=1965318 RepID=UPI0035683823